MTDPAPSADRALVPDRARVLVVDDEPDIREILGDWLRPRGFAVETAGDADTALARLREGGVDALILDLHLPGRDGMEVLEAVRRRDSDLAIVIMTGFATADSAIEALRQRADDYIQKPFDLKSLDYALSHALERRRLQRENRRLVRELRATNEDLDRRVEAKTRSLSTLLDIARELSCTLDLDPVLTHIAERARELSAASAALLYLRQDPTGYHLEVSTGLDPERHPELIDTVGACVEQLARDGLAWRPAAPPPPLRSALAVPLLWEGRSIGVLALLDRSGRSSGDSTAEFSQEDEDLALGFATHAAVAIRNAQIYEEAKRLDRLQSEFIAAVSHELRTPLTGLKAPLELLAKNYGQALNDSGRELLGYCRAAADQLEDLVELILFSAESGEALDLGQLETVEVGALVRAAVQRIEGVAAQRRVPIETGTIEPDIRVLANRRGLVRVLVCLLSNAVKFSEREQCVRLRVEADAERVQIHVIDRGLGIDSADQPLIFRRFAQLDGSLTRRASGTGLGLSVAKALVEQHGGEIRVSSRVDAGSRFTVELPRLAAGIGDDAGAAGDVGAAAA